MAIAAFSRLWRATRTRSFGLPSRLGDSANAIMLEPHEGQARPIKLCDQPFHVANSQNLSVNRRPSWQVIEVANIFSASEHRHRTVPEANRAKSGSTGWKRSGRGLAIEIAADPVFLINP